MSLTDVGPDKIQRQLAGTPMADTKQQMQPAHPRATIANSSGVFRNLNKMFPHINRPLVVWPNEAWMKLGEFGHDVTK